MSKTHGVHAIEAVFADSRAAGRGVLIPYLTLGYPTPERSIALVEAAVDGGADIVELGIPFSDPLADGPVIQRATHAALEAGATVERCLEWAGRLRNAHPEPPFLFMGYLNPILAFGAERFCQSCRDAGVDGLIVPDLPPDEADEIERHCRAAGIALVFLAAPNTPEARLRTICEHSSGYIYLVSLTGTTGARDQLPTGLTDFVARVRALTAKPLAVGFGIAKPEHAAQVARIADGAIVGSAVVDRCTGAEAEMEVRRFVEELRAALG